jgi:hypothetical protein
MLTYRKISTSTSSGNTNQNDLDGGGYIFITNVEAIGGNISDIIYEPNTVPTDVVLNECTTDTSDIRIHFIAEGGRD